MEHVIVVELEHIAHPARLALDGIDRLESQIDAVRAFAKGDASARAEPSRRLVQSTPPMAVVPKLVFGTTYRSSPIRTPFTNNTLLSSTLALNPPGQCLVISFWVIVK